MIESSVKIKILKGAILHNKNHLVPATVFQMVSFSLSSPFRRVDLLFVSPFLSQQERFPLVLRLGHDYIVSIPIDNLCDKISFQSTF